MVAREKREGTQGMNPHRTSGYTLISCHSLLTPLPLPSSSCATVTLWVCVVNWITGRLKRQLFGGVLALLT